MNIENYQNKEVPHHKIYVPRNNELLETSNKHSSLNIYSTDNSLQKVSIRDRNRSILQNVLSEKNAHYHRVQIKAKMSHE